METKPRLSYAEVFAMKNFKEGTVAWLIQKYLDEMGQPGGRKLGASHDYTLRKLQRERIGTKQHDALKPMDFIEHCKARLSSAKPVKPQTVNQDMTYLSGVLKHAFEVWEMSEDGHKAYRKAKPQLIRQQLISKSQRRDRRPTADELERILAECEVRQRRKKQKIPLRAIVEFQVYSARRISETCRLRWGDVDMEKRVCLVRDLKNPKGKGFHDTFPLLGRAWDIVIAQPRRSTDPDERIFPYNSHSVSASVTELKNALGIKNLRLHDMRREAISRYFEQGYGVPEVAKVSLHRNPTQLLGTYTALKAEDLHKGPASKRQQAAS